MARAVSPRVENALKVASGSRIRCRPQLRVLGLQQAGLGTWHSQQRRVPATPSRCVEEAGRRLRSTTHSVSAR